MSNLKFGPLPDKATVSGGGFFGAEVREALKDRPGEWAIVHTTVNSALAWQWRDKFPDFETTTRVTDQKDDKGRRLTDIHARYVGA